MRLFASVSLCLLLGFVAAVTGRRQQTCVVEASGTNKTDDAPAIREAFERCGHGGKVVFKPTTYYVNSVLDISGLKDVDVDLQGKLLVSYRMNCTQLKFLGSPSSSGVRISHTGLIILSRSATRTNPQPSS